MGENVIDKVVNGVFDVMLRGSIRWEVKLEGCVECSAAITGDFSQVKMQPIVDKTRNLIWCGSQGVICCMVDGHVLALSPEGAVVWKAVVGGPIFAGACISSVLTDQVWLYQPQILLTELHLCVLALIRWYGHDLIQKRLTRIISTLVWFTLAQRRCTTCRRLTVTAVPPPAAVLPPMPSGVGRYYRPKLGGTIAQHSTARRFHRLEAKWALF
ncbi:PQQ [Musa troglodytarum]|uniref:PQQ n=1 Tax=Musa troglodytarum TaxID=320322 RepID=A0A9E7JCQ1_9LILI|nr:PQQ [Musa troglodytarum]